METINLTYVGRVVTTKDKIGYKYHNEKDGTHIYGRKIATSEVVGNIVQCNKKDENSVCPPYKIIGAEQNQNKVAEWQARDRLIFAEYNASRFNLKAHKNYYDKNVKGLTEIYKGLSPSQRVPFLILLTKDISNG